MRRRPNFSVAVTVVVLFIGLTFAANLIRPLVPQPPPNPIANYAGDYLKQAASEQIDWLPADVTAFSEARRLDRPVLLFIGVAWSQTARELDQDVLGTSDIQNYLSHNFVCVRIDGNEMPAWVSAYLPISRVAIGIRPRFQIWALQPDGKLIANINRRLPTTRLAQGNFLNELIKVHDYYTQIRQQGVTSDMETEQRADVAQIESQSPSPTVDFDGVAASIRSIADTREGGFPINGFQDLRPSIWSLLIERGDNKLLHDTLMPTLRSRAVDVLDGGFFQTARSIDRSQLEFDKSAVINAEMLCVLAQARSTFRDPVDRAMCDYTLQSTANSLMGEFGAPSGFIRTARIGDEQDDGRSSRSSISPKRLRESLDPDERDWARVHLGLRVESNPQMIAFLAGEDALSRVDAIREKLLPGAAAPTFTTDVLMDVNGTVAARLMEAGRATRNANLIKFGSDLFTELDHERVGDTVPHDLEVAGRSSATLLDYLAYSDAALQDYLTSGRVPSFTNGLAVLQRALSTFAGPVPGEFRVGLPPSSDLIPSAVATAQVVDDMGESASSKVMRLCTAYGRMLIASSSEDDPGLALLRIAYATQSLLSQPVGTLGVMSSSFAAASLTLDDDEYAIAVGPDAQSIADQLFAARPTRFIAAAFGPVRTDLAKNAAGIFIVTEGVPSGPMTLQQAESKLAIALKPQG